RMWSRMPPSASLSALPARRPGKRCAEVVPAVASAPEIADRVSRWAASSALGPRTLGWVRGLLGAGAAEPTYTPFVKSPTGHAVVCQVSCGSLMSALDELLNRWRKSPEAGATIALCSHLGTSHRSDLIAEVGALAQQHHAHDSGVMLAVGRMYLDVGMLPEAQTALVQAGRADAQNGMPFRFLGEVLLRRGDAI